MIIAGLRSQSTPDTSKSLIMDLIKDGFVGIAKKKLLKVKKYSNIALGKCFLHFRMNSEK